MLALTNLFFLRLWKKALPVLAVIAGLSLGSFLALARLAEPGTYRFDYLLGLAGVPTLFYLAFFLVILLGLHTVFELCWSSRAIYTFMRLPIPRAAIFAAFYLAILLMLTIVVVIHMLLVMLCGALMPLASSKPLFDGLGYMRQYLPLAFVRTTSLHLFTPLSVPDALRTAAILLTPGAGVLCLNFSLMSRHYGNLFWIMIWAVGYVQLFYMENLSSPSAWFLWLRLAAQLVFFLFFCGSSLYALKSGAVLRYDTNGRWLQNESPDTPE